MMMALAGCGDLPAVLVPGGVTLLAEEAEDTARVQTLSARFAHGEIIARARRGHGLPRLRLAGGRVPVHGDRGHGQVVGEALGLSLPHSALGPSGAPIWLDMARRSALALMELEGSGASGRPTS